MARKGFQVGQGHSGNSNLAVIREVLPENMTVYQRHMLNFLEPGTRVFRMGKVKVFLSPPSEATTDAPFPGWHMSISCEGRYPSWDEVAKAWYELVPDAEQRTGIMVLPPKSDYINIHEYCFQIHELVGADVSDE